MSYFRHFPTFLILSLSFSGTTGKLIDVSLKESGYDFDILINDQVWFSQDVSSSLSNIYVTKDHSTFSTQDQSLMLQDVHTSTGEDIFGVFDSIAIDWQPEETGFQTGWRSYQDEPMIIFTQFFQKALNGTDINHVEAYDRLSTSFPSLLISKSYDLGHLSFGASMAGWVGLTVSETRRAPDTIRSGQLGGPVAFFDRDYQAVVLISPLNHFMITNQVTDIYTNDSTVLSYGLMGSIQAVPKADTKIEFVMVAGNTFDEAFSKWGSALRKYHGKSLDGIQRDVARKYLGYWTDNGAYYYYNTMPDKNYENTLVTLKKTFEEEKKLPFQYIEIDSWWYFKGPFLGVTNWTSLPEIFPNGLIEVKQKTGWTFAAHNRYWSGYTSYADENGGNFYFVIEKDELNRSIALPQDSQFWAQLFKDSKKWGMEMYEQDWLDVQYLTMNITRQDFWAAENWLLQMGQGASVNNVLIKYCMSLPRQILSSVQVESVNAARVSGDYRLSRDNWRIGLSSYLATSLGLAAFKDTFWSSPVNTEHPFYYDCMIGQDEQDPNVPWTIAYRYDGLRSKTLSGKECISWYDLDLHYTAPNNDLERNACRIARGLSHLGGEGKPWCFTKASLQMDVSLWEWETCDIPVCNKDCRRGDTNKDDPNLPLCGLLPETNPERQAVVSLISRGGVGPGDGVDFLNEDVIMATCRQDGRLLVPDWPAKAAPIQMLKMAFSDSLRNPRVPHALGIGEIWSTQTTLNERYVYPLLFCSEVGDFEAASWKSLALTDPKLNNSEEYLLYSHSKADSGFVVTSLLKRSRDLIHIPKLDVDQFMTFFMAPLWTMEESSSSAFQKQPKIRKVALLGEQEKYVPISRERILRVELSSEMHVTLQVIGAPGEVVSMSLATLLLSDDDNEDYDWAIKQSSCRIPDTNNRCQIYFTT